ncbi:MAG TPA: hypothetical protein PKC86_00110 [Candidatus Saccharibacteria bacterium]|nr:hypothetical protein [Candidatus Saccharibacteria bacterium]
MKSTIIESVKQLVADRYLVVLLSFLVLLAIGFLIYIGLSVRPSELQTVTHYSAFGVRHLYTSQWFYLYVFGLFGLVVAAAHTVLSIKILIVKGRSLAIMLAWLGVGILVLGWITAYMVINVRMML